MSQTRTCTFKGCDKPYYGYDLCNGHYQQKMRGVSLSTLRPNRSNGACAERDEAGNKFCINCEHWLPESAFLAHGATRDKLQPYCRLCQAARAQARQYGLTPQLKAEILAQQGGTCAICEREFGSQICVDHDHACCPGIKSCGFCVRGLLCHYCNKGLGHFSDDPAYLRRAADYLDSWAAVRDSVNE